MLKSQENAAKAQASAKEAEQNADALWKQTELHYNAVLDAEFRGLGLQIDLDLAELRTDAKVGLLRLARPLKHTFGPIPIVMQNSHGTMNLDVGENPRFIELREFATMAVLASGQRFAPLLPPITHDGQAIASAWLSPDNQTLLTLGKDYTARLWDVRTAKQIAVLRKGDERIVNCGFSPDGRTIFTDDQTSVARFWDVPSGQFRTAIEARQNRYVIPDWWLWGENSDKSITPKASQLSASRLLTRRRVGKESKVTGAAPDLGWEGPAELWDTATGRLVARLDAPGRDARMFQLVNGGRWITMLEGSSTLLVYSAEDGRLLARLNHPAGEYVQEVDVSPSGRRLATMSGATMSGGNGSLSLRVWDAEKWRAGPVTTLVTHFESVVHHFRFWMDDLPENPGEIIALEEAVGWGASGWTVYRYGQNEPVAEFVGAPPWTDLLARVGDLAHGGDGRVYNTGTWQRLTPPPGRKFHPELARFAPDGRFVRAAINGKQALIDTRTDKSFPTRGDWGKLPKFGMIQATTPNYDGITPANYEATIRLIPSGSRLDLPTDLLELWAQVAIRGEIDAEGRFKPWDEATWEKHRQELAAKPAPYPDFPFPGHVATDKLHWLRQEYESASDKDKPSLAKQLLDRAEAAGDMAEAVRWRAIVAPKSPPAKPAASK